MLYNVVMQRLAGKTVFITGASRGIGAETALGFAKEGCNIVITFLGEIGSAEKVQKQCLVEGAKKVEIVQLDVKNRQSIKNATTKGLERYRLCGR